MASATKQCKHCYSMIDKRASVCPHCQKPQRIQIGCLSGCLIVIVAFVFLGMIIPSFFHSKEKSSSLPIPATKPAPKPTKKSVKVIKKKDGTIDKRINDLEELCKDYLYYRNKITKAVNSGNKQEAERARAHFQDVNISLGEYKENDIQAMFTKLDEEGYHAP